MYLLSLYLCRYLKILCLIVIFLKIIKIDDVKSSIVRMIKVMMEFFELVRFVVFLIVLFL